MIYNHSVTALPKLTLADVRNWVGQREIDKGRPYTQGGAIVHPLRQGMTLKAQCWGTAPSPYRVTVTLSDTGIAASDCSCPVGGRCKHVAALLLLYLQDPEGFTEIEALRVSLEKRSKDELIALIEKMLKHHPELERLIELPQAASGKPLTPQLVKRQVERVFGDLSYRGWDDEDMSSVGRELTQLVELGDGYLPQGNLASALAVYQTVVEEVLKRYGELSDEEGELAEVVTRCVEGLASLLVATGDVAMREDVLRILFEVYLEDLRLGGYGLGDDVPEKIVHYASEAERARVAAWVREALLQETDPGESFRRQAMGQFLLELHGGELDDESYLRLCRESGRVKDLVERLLLLGRVDEALQETAKVEDYELLTLAELFVQQGYGERVHPLIEARAAQHPPERHHAWRGRLNTWLRDWARRSGDHARALELTEAMFWQHPHFGLYRELRHDAERAGRWQTVRIGLLKRLEKARNHELLTEIYLHEGEVAAALSSIKQTYGGALAIRVAQAAEADHPEAALALYRNEIDRLIEARGRESYQQAARYLLRARDLHERLGLDWQSYLARLKDEYRRWRALQEELRRAGL
jgi:uncharacterized Zn finger protein